MLLSESGYAQTHEDTLTGLVDRKLVHINRNNGAIGWIKGINGLPSSVNPFRLTWCEPNQCFYTHIRVGGVTSIARISGKGQYKVLGSVTVPGNTLYFAEGIAFNRADGQLYISGSLDGSIPGGDYWSEALIRVDTGTLVGTVVGYFNHNVSHPDADKITFGDNGKLYYEDGQPGSFLRLYEQSLPFSSSAVTILADPYYYVTGGLTVKDNVLYYTTNRALHGITLGSWSNASKGTMFTSNEFNGQLLNGLAWRADSCPNPDILEFDKAVLCDGDSLRLDAGNGAGWDYSWSTGATDSIITILGPQSIWVHLSNGVCEVSDTLMVIPAPELPNQLLDTALCAGQSIEIDLSGYHVTWQEGLNAPVYNLNKPGNYKAVVSNTCNVDTLTFEVSEKDCNCRLYIPNAFTPNDDEMNDSFGPELLCDLETYHFTVFNKWGELIFSSMEVHKRWDGTYLGHKVKSDVYVWKLDYESQFGSTPDGSLYGRVTVLR